MPNLLRDGRHAIRLLLRRPGFGVTITATIALAIAGNTVMFGLVRGILLNPLPLPDSGTLVRVEQIHATGSTNVTGATFKDVKARTTTVADLAAFRTAPATFSAAGQALQITTATVTRDYFAQLRLGAVAGRLPETADFSPGGERAIVLSRAIWERVFSSSPAAVGTTVLVNASPRVVAGVVDVPASTPGAADAWLPYDESEAIFRNRRARLFTVVGRLREGVTPASATAELASIASAIVRETPEVGRDMSLRATSLRDRIVQPVRSSLLLLWGAVGVLSVIAFANVANLLLMEGSVRERELTLRTALGAPRSALILQLAIEAGTAGLAGGIAGAALGAWGLGLLRGVLPASLPRVTDVRVDPVLILSGIALAIAASTAFGLVPAVRASRRDAASALRAREGSGQGSRLRDGLVAAEIALTLVLLFGTALLGRSLWAAIQTPMGFEAADVVTADLSLPAGRYPDAEAHALFYATVADSLAAVPGIDAAAVTGALPLTPTAATTMVATDGPADDQPVADVISATPGFFDVMRIRLVRGRTLVETDRAGAAPVAVINEAAARTLWPAGLDPIGRELEMRDWGSPFRARVVGIIGDVKQGGADAAARPAVYYPLAQFPQTTLTQTIVVRSRAPLAVTVGTIRAAVRRLDASQPIGVTATMEARIAGALAQRRFNLLVLAAFASAALLLAGVGVYGIVAFAMAARAREIAVRIALGAAPRQIVWLAVTRGASPIVAGAIAGIAVSWLGAAVVSGLLYGVVPRDVVSLAIAASLMVAAGAAAIAGPALKALRVDPVTAFRLP